MAEEKMLYLECSSGISGDMAVAALLDLGTSEEKAAREAAVLEVLDSLPVQGFEIRISRVTKSGLDACDFDVVLDAEHENHDHDMEYLYGHVHGEDHDHEHAHEDGTVHSHDHAHHHHDHDHEHAHSHDHVHAHAHPHEDDAHAHEHAHSHGGGRDHEHSREHTHHHDNEHSHAHEHAHHHHHEHRNLADVVAIIDGSCATEGAKQIARDVFAVIAQAEAKAHGESIDQVHFHEVGAVDSIADVLAFAVCLDHLAVKDVVVTELAEGKGTVRCQHGVLPVPVPAVVNIVSEHGVPLRIIDIEGELVTPTGAAFAAATRTKAQLPERFIIKSVGLGAGKREYKTAGVVRALLIEER